MTQSDELRCYTTRSFAIYTSHLAMLWQRNQGSCDGWICRPIFKREIWNTHRILTRLPLRNRKTETSRQRPKWSQICGNYEGQSVDVNCSGLCPQMYFGITRIESWCFYAGLVGSVRYINPSLNLWIQPWYKSFKSLTWVVVYLPSRTQSKFEAEVCNRARKVL